MCFGAAYPLVRPESFPNLPPQPNDYLWFIPGTSHTLISWRMSLTSHDRPNDTPGVCHEHDTITNLHPKKLRRKEERSEFLSTQRAVAHDEFHCTCSYRHCPCVQSPIIDKHRANSSCRWHPPRPTVFILEFAGYAIIPSFQSIPRVLICPVPPHDLTDLTFYMNRIINGPISFCYRACLCSPLNEIGDSGKPRVDFAWVGWKVRQCAGWPPPSAKRARRGIG